MKTSARGTNPYFLTSEVKYMKSLNPTAKPKCTVANLMLPNGEQYILPSSWDTELGRNRTHVIISSSRIRSKVYLARKLTVCACASSMIVPDESNSNCRYVDEVQDNLLIDTFGKFVLYSDLSMI